MTLHYILHPGAAREAIPLLEGARACRVFEGLLAIARPRGAPALREIVRSSSSDSQFARWFENTCRGRRAHAPGLRSLTICSTSSIVMSSSSCRRHRFVSFVSFRFVVTVSSSSRSRRGLFRHFKAIVVVVGRARRASLGRCRACALSGGGGACGRPVLTSVLATPCCIQRIACVWQAIHRRSGTEVFSSKRTCALASHTAAGRSARELSSASLQNEHRGRRSRTAKQRPTR